MAAAARLLLLLVVLGWVRPGACTDPPGGGWLAGTVPEEPRCTVERADASLTYSLFLQRFAFSRPVILGGVTDNSAFRALCTRDKLLAAFGPFPVRLSTANTYSYRKVDVPFQEYVEHLLKPQDPARLGSDTLYFFGDNNFTEWGPLFQHYVPPPFRIPGTSPAYSFGIAGSGSGVPFHWHGPGFSEVIFGRKRWFLYPPDQTPHFHPNESTLAWLQHTYPTLPPAQRPLECTLRPGEVSQHCRGPQASQPEPCDPTAVPCRSCTSPTAGGTPHSTWTPASSSPPSWARAGRDKDTSPPSQPDQELQLLPPSGTGHWYWDQLPETVPWSLD
ncbi:jmjC domain-containing protein 8 isoform X6 [Onychostruthus taczanowskii]|uniref:jmjC domain-containing protein 8 isoform X6 n=1 Tax=Onychostruthus taczanowskii TaxID=356909 RepID=UPI001B80BC62|nr:jmjC domain-containing protein 8 isoform X6 [Onychostruthus taczanowskii]